MATALDELLAAPGADTDELVHQLTTARLAGETPEETVSREVATDRIKAKDLASRGIPSFHDAYGHVAPITDETGAALTHLDKRHGIAWDSAGQPKAISYDEGAPILNDPFAGIPVSTDAKTGHQYQKVKGLPWNWVGQDPQIAAQRRQQETDKALKAEATLEGQKLTLEHGDLVIAGQQVKDLKKQLVDPQLGVPELADPKYQGADLETVKKGIDAHFDAEYGSPEANEKAGWFNDELSPAAIAKRADIDKRKAATHETATQLFDTGAQVNELATSAQTSREKRRAMQETLIAHKEGRLGPLDPEYQQSQFDDQARQAFEEKKAALEASFTNPTGSAATRSAATGLTPDSPQAVRTDVGDHIVGQLGVKPGIWDKVKGFIGEVVGAGATTVSKGLEGFAQASEAIYHGVFGGDEKATATRSIIYALQKVPGVVTNPALKDTTEAKAGRLVGEYGSLIGEAILNPAIAVTNMVGLGYEGQHDAAAAYFDAQAKANPDKPRNIEQEQATADRAGVLGAAINGVLAMVPIGKAGAAIKEFFGKAETDVVAKALNQAYERGGAGGVANVLNELKGAMAKTGSPAFAEVASKGLQGVIDEISKSPADRLASVAGRAVTDAGWFSAAQVGQNLVSKTYNPDTGLFENVPSAAATGAVLGTIGGTFEQVARANKARQAEIDIKSALAKQAGVPPPPEGGLPAPASPEPTKPAGPTEKVVTGKEVTPTTPVEKGGGKVGEQEIKRLPEGEPPAEPIDTEVEGARTPAAEKPADTSDSGRVLTPNPEPRSMSRPDIERELGGMGYTVESDGTLSKRGETVQPQEARAVQLHEELQSKPIEKGKQTFDGVDVTIHNEPGEVRKEGHQPLQTFYGSINEVKGADGGNVDVLVKAGTTPYHSGPVFVIDQTKADGGFDEHKVVVGAKSGADAVATYNGNYPKGWDRIGRISQFGSLEKAKEFLQQSQPKPTEKPKGEVVKKLGGGLSYEQATLRKLATGVLNQHKVVLTSLGHTEAVEGTTESSSGIETNADNKITFDWAKLHEATKGLSPRARTKYIQRAVAEEVLHVAGRKWAGEKPENRQAVVTWGGEKDELDGHMAGAYAGWEKLTDEQKGHEKLRAVLQKRWTGKLTEAAYRALREFLKYLRGIWDKLTPDQKTMVGEVEARMGRETSPKEPVAPEKPSRETSPTKYVLPSFVTEQYKKPSKEMSLAERRTKKTALEERHNAVAGRIPAKERQIVRTLLHSNSPVEAQIRQAEQIIAKYETAEPKPLSQQLQRQIKVLEAELKKLRGGLPVAEDMMMNDRGASLDRLEKKIQDVEDKINQLRRGGEEHATETGEKPKGSEPEHTGVSPGTDLPAHEEQIREGDRGQAGGRGGAGERAPTPAETQPRAGQPSEKPAVTSTLDEATQQQMRDAFEGLAAAPPVQLIKAPAIRLKDGTIVSVPEGKLNWHASAVDHSIATYGAKATTGFEKGYITTNGHFLTKDQAWKTARIGSSVDLEEAQRFALGAASPEWITWERPKPHRLKAAAIKFPDGRIVEGGTHALALANAEGIEGPEAEYGFTTTHGLFLTREEAKKATGAGETSKAFSPVRDLGRRIKDETSPPLGAALPHDPMIGAPVAPIPQKAIPSEKLGAFVNLAQSLIKKGIDTPEKLARELDAVIPEKGRGYAQAVWDMLGTVNPVLRGTHDWRTHFAALAVQPKKEEPTSITNEVAKRLTNGDGMSRVELTALAHKLGVETKQADEQAELGIVKAAGALATSAKGRISPVDTFDEMVRLYENQPNLTAKTSTSKIAQAYSTPVPLAYAASRLADIVGGKSIYEPTAGNGVLLIETSPDQTVHANELNAPRLLRLKQVGDFEISAQDATKWLPPEKVDREVENPPFGTVLDANGNNKTWEMWDAATSQIDHAIVAKSLEALKDDGRAVLIIGGKNIVDPEQRAQAYAQGGRFYKELYARYRVIDHFTIDGDLYKKQGAGWPVDVIVIAGRGRSPIQLPSAVPPRILSSWEQLRDELTRTDDERIKAGAFDEGKAGAEAGGVFADIRTIAGSAGGTREPSGVQQPSTGTGPGGVTTVAGSVTGKPAEPVPSTSGSTEVAGGRAGGISVLEPVGEPVERGTVDPEQFRIPYRPASKAESFNIFIPTNMDAPVHDALEKLQKEVGDLDKYVVENLGYTPPKTAFAAEQIDALALAIRAVEKGRAFVLGDQGGVGKGRVAAGMMVYSINKGYLPVFITKDVKLYAAMIGDLSDIARADIVPIFTDVGITFEDEKGKVWKTGKTMPLMDQIAASGTLPPEAKVLFTTYNQIQADVPKGYKPDKLLSAALKAQRQPPPDGSRMKALKRIAPNAVFIMDESHLASGDSIRAWRIAPLLEKAPAAYYSSATFMKRPESAGIYLRTTLSHAAKDMDELVDAMTLGGAPLQQASNAMLAQDGLYMRRERDFSGTVFDVHVNKDTSERDRALADTYTGGLRKIVGISNTIEEATKRLNRLMKRAGKKYGATATPRLEATNFSEKLHNLVSQYLFAIKAESTAQNAIRAVKEGLVGADKVKRPHRVVITMQNTMQAGIEDLAGSGRELNFKGMLLSYLDSMRRLRTGRKAFGHGETEEIYISDTPDPELTRYSDHDLERQLFRIEHDDEGNKVGVLNENVAQELFRRIISAKLQEVAAEIEKLELSDMPLSPIDYIRQQLTKAGIKNVEMTGRSIGIDAAGKTYEIPPTAHSKKAHLRAMNEFNNGDAQVILMNASGSTGISMHASSKFKNQDPRAMIVIQPHLDINEFMQTLWRIDRTGQVHKPHYIILQTTIPAELRIAAVLTRKMSLLNANTTSNSESEMRKGVDLVNKYGDEVVYDYLRSDPGFVTLLQWRAITDKAPKSYKEEPDRYILKPWDALEFEESGKLVAGVTGHMAILPVAEQDSFYEKVLPDYDALIKYLTATGQNDLVAQTIDMKAETLSSRELTPAKGSGDSVFDAPSMLERVKAEVGKKPRQAEEVLEKADEVEKGARQIYLKFLNDSQAWIDKNTEGKAESWPARMRDAREVIANALDLLGQTVHLKNDRGLDAFGAVVDVKLDEEHPLTPSAQKFKVWVNTTQRTIELAATQLTNDAKRTPRDDFIEAYRGSEERSNERYIVTGNLLAGSVAIRDTAPGAKIVQYTNDKGELRQGILLPAKFSADSLAAKAPVENASHMRQLLDAGRGLTNEDQSVQVTQSPSKGGYLLRIAASKVKGGTYWQDPRLNAMMSTGEFIGRANSLVGNFTAEKLPQVYDRLQELGSPLYFWKSVDNEGPSLGAAAPTQIIKDYWKKDVADKLANANAAFHEVLDAVVKVVSPSYGVNKDAVDRVHKLLGDRNQVNYVIDRTLHSFEKAFDKMPRPDQIAFIDRMKRGEKQPSDELQKVADMLRKIDSDSWAAAEQEFLRAGHKESPLKWLDNHYRVIWKKIPGAPTGERWTPGRGRRPLAGSKGMMKQHTLEDMSEGIELGGVPISYNPVTMFKLAQADIWKLTTALKMWNWGKENGLVEYVRGPFPKVPNGMTWIDDNISRVYFPAASGEGLIEPGRYAVEEGFGRLLNNYLSRDLIRATHAGRSLLWVKNFTTSIELSLSVFHGVFETMEAIGSNIGLGLSKISNKGGPENKRDFLGGMMEIVKSFHSPVSGYSLGKAIRKAAGDPDAFFQTDEGKKLLKVYPRAREMINDLFTGGWKPTELEADWKNNSIRTFVDAVADLKTGTSSNYIGAGLRAFPAANEMMMKPLFDYYIPNLKLAQFFREYDEALRSNERKLSGGVLTRAALARQVWRLVEDRFGELNYDTLFWNNTFKSAMQLMFRSVTWKLGSVEAFGNAFAGQAKEFINAAKEKRAPELHRNMAWLFGMFLLTAAIGYVMSETLGKKKPKNLTDFVFPQIDPRDSHVRVSIPTYFKDLVHLIHSPFGYVKSSMAGWIGRVADLLTNKDYFGVQIRNTDDPITKQALQVGKYSSEMLLPFSVRGYRNLSEQQVNTLRKSMALLGVNPAPRYVGQSAAEHRVDEIMRGRKTEAGITPEQFEKSRSKRAMVSELRHGKPVDIAGALSRGTLKPADVPALYKRAQMGQLASSINYMSLPEAESVFEKATATEKAEMSGIMQRKRQGSAARATKGKLMFTGF